MPGRLAGRRRFAVYYGPGREGLFPGYDLLILEPAAWPPSQIRTLRAGGTMLLAYLPLLEAPDRGGAPPGNVLIADGRPRRNATWQTWVVDPRHPDTHRSVLDAAAALRDAGWDGLFLDTVAAAEAPDLPVGLRTELIPTAAELVAAVASAWPTAPLVQNWGFGPLLSLTAPYLDGLCWEDFDAAAPLADRLQSWSRSVNLAVLALNEACTDRDATAAAAERLGFLWYGAPGAYTRLPLQEVEP